MKTPEPSIQSERISELFLDNLHLAVDGPLSDRFFALKSEGSGNGFWRLFPFRPELLAYLDLGALRKQSSDVVKCFRIDQAGESFMEVTVIVGGVRFSRCHPWKTANRDMIGNALDVRIWPDIRFLTTPRLSAVNEDRVHYFRVRQKTEWNLRPLIIARSVLPDGAGSKTVIELFKAKSWDPGWPDELDPDSFRMARCYAFPATGACRISDGKPVGGEWEPIGLSFEGRGFCLFTLAEPAVSPQGRAMPLRIGVNVGAEYTCVAAAPDLPGAESTPMEVHFESQTMSLHLYPKYERLDDILFREIEGAAAVLDFPYKYADETHMTEAACLPTPWLTRLPEGAEPINTEFLMSNGLICVRDLTAVKDIEQLLYDCPPAPVPDRRPFRITSDIHGSSRIWHNRTYRMPFLWHLYKMMVYHAARNSAWISSAAFSFPQFFDKNSVDEYRNELNLIFHDHGKVPLEAIAMMAENDAMLSLLAGGEVPEDSLVLDVRMSATGLVGLFQKRRLQASYGIAAGLISRYFTSSPPLQRMFEAALWKVIKTEEAGTRKGDQQWDQRKALRDLFSARGDQLRVGEEYLEQGFFRMLGMLEERHYPSFVVELQRLGACEQSEVNRKALAGFFYTLVLFYAGIAYQTGRLMRLNRLATVNVKLRLIGEGLRFRHFLNPCGTEFSRVVQAMFQTGYEQRPEVRIVIEPGAHTLVAKGLLTPSNGECAQVIPDTESHEYLLKRGEQLAVQVPQFPTPEQFEALMRQDLMPFLGALDLELPHGRSNGSTVIPFCEPSLVYEFRSLFVPMTTAVINREVYETKFLREECLCAARLGKASEKAASAYYDSAQSAESVFLIRLKCLIDEIRHRYAHSEQG